MDNNPVPGALLARFRVVHGATTGEPAPALPAWLTAKIAAPALPANAYSLTRRQFAADIFLALLPAADRGEAVLCATPADLFLEKRAFVFGASLPECGVAVVSTARLGGSAARIDKVARHELGHLAGLPDCGGNCLMTPAASAPNLDARPYELCPRCAARLAALPIVA